MRLVRSQPMTRKLTDEQIRAIDRLVPQRGYYSIKIAEHPQLKENAIIVMLDEEYEGVSYKIEHPVLGNSKVFIGYKESSEYLNLVVKHIEHLINQRYCWLPQQQDWIMSGELYNFANNGANKVLELAFLAGISSLLNPWYRVVGEGSPPYNFNGVPSFDNYLEGVTLPVDSPIWDAVKEST